MKALAAVASFSLLAAPAAAQNSVTLVSAKAFANFHAAGVVVTVTGDLNRNATVALAWRPAGGVFRAAQPLARIDATHFAGSLFSLTPAKAYEARATIADANGVVGAATRVAAFTTRADTLPEPSLRTLHVATTGNDQNAGTHPGSPLRTIQRAANLSQAGDLILVAPGVYRESVNVPSSGTAAQPIVFRGNGAGVIVDGADAAIAAGVAWTAQANGVYSRTTGFATGHVVTEQGRLFRYDSLAALQALGAGAPGGFFFNGTTLYVKLLGSDSPAGHTMHVARFEDGFVVDSRNFVRIENLEIRHYGAGDYGKGVYLRYANNCTVRLCRIHEVETAGVWIKGGQRHRVEDNEIWDTSIPDWPWDETKGSHAENNAIAFTDQVGRGHVVRRNVVRGTFNGIAPCGSTAPAGGVITTEVDVYQNTLSQHNDDAFEPEGYCSNVRMWGNTIRDVHMAFAVAPAAPGPTYIVRNIAYNFGNTRSSQMDGWMASALKINSGYPTPVGPLFVFHNTFVTDAPGTDGIALLNPGTSTFLRLRNNVIAATSEALYKVNPVVLQANGDDLYTSASGHLVYWMGAHHNTLAAVRTVLGQEKQGISAAPQLVNPAGGLFAPASTSPLIDKAIKLSGINDVYTGTAADIGAIEAP